jgi:hypothetical protein
MFCHCIEVGTYTYSCVQKSLMRLDTKQVIISYKFLHTVADTILTSYQLNINFALKYSSRQ